MDNFKQFLQANKEQLGDDLPQANLWKKIEEELDAKTIVAPRSGSSLPNKKAFIVSMVKWAVAACIIGLAGVGAWFLVNNKTANNPTVATITNPTIVTPKIKDVATINTISLDVDTPFSVLKNLKAIVQNPNESKQDFVSALTKEATVTPSMSELQKSELNGIQVNFNQVINLQKNKLNQTPLYGENAAYYSDFVDKFKQMEKDEKLVKKDILQYGFTAELMEQLINVYQQKLNVLKLLQNEIQKTNIRYRQNRNAVDTVKTTYLEI